jgi:hypothetical protein
VPEWSAEVTVDADLARRLIAEQSPSSSAARSGYSAWVGTQPSGWWTTNGRFAFLGDSTSSPASRTRWRSCRKVVAAGVNFLKVGPATRPWWPEDVAEALSAGLSLTQRFVQRIR